MDRSKQALGIIETRGYVPLVTAVDAALKAANVSLATRRLVGGGLVNATVAGDVGSVRAATAAASAVIAALGARGQTWVIARPAAEVREMLAEDGLGSPPPAGGPPPAPLGPKLPVPRPEPEVPALRAEAGPPASIIPESELARAVRAVKKTSKKPRKPGGRK